LGGIGARRRQGRPYEEQDGPQQAVEQPEQEADEIGRARRQEAGDEEREQPVGDEEELDEQLGGTEELGRYLIEVGQVGQPEADQQQCDRQPEQLALTEDGRQLADVL